MKLLGAHFCFVKFEGLPSCALRPAFQSSCREAGGSSRGFNSGRHGLRVLVWGVPPYASSP